MSTGSTPLLGMALIVRDEAETITACMESWWDHVDRVAVVDTGSRDNTMEVVRAFADERGERAKLSTGTFEWVDDFAAARRAADALLEDCEWRGWCDADDLIVGAERLRAVVEQADPQVGAFISHYDYAHDPHGNVVCHLKRERLVRRGHGRWDGRVHEAQVMEGQIVELPPEMVRWVHRKPAERGGTSKRNLRILRKWLTDEPHNPRVLQYLGTEELVRAKPRRAISYFRRYLALKTGWDEERAQVHRKLAVALLAEGRPDEATRTALEALTVLPTWPDSYLSLAEAAYGAGDFPKAAMWARRVLELGAPDTLLITNPLDYTLSPRLILSGALGALGQFDEAIALADEALQIVPDHHELLVHSTDWRRKRQNEATAQTVVELAQFLTNHDEQLKALDLLERAVPHQCVDHPAVVDARSRVRERVRPLLEPSSYREHYRDGSQPEDMVDDERIEPLCDALPRAQFLLDGLREQAAEVGEEVAA